MLSISQQNFTPNIFPFSNLLWRKNKWNYVLNSPRSAVQNASTQIAFLKAFGSFDRNQMDEIFSEALIPRIMTFKDNLISLSVGNDIISLRTTPSPVIYLQRRGFRTQKIFIEDNKKRELPDTSRGFLGYISDKFNIFSTGKASELNTSEKYNLYLKDRAKLSSDQMDGLIRGLLLNSKQMGKESNKKNVTYSKFFVAFGLGLFLFGIYLLLNSNGKLLNFIPDIKEFKPEATNVTFDDVRGMDEAKLEVKEIVNYLRDPERYSRLGGRLPKGVLLIGPPGTGKTLLARAIAGEADVPFYHASGSEFDEILVGQGAKRIRDLFARAKTTTPCIIFIDEIDSVGAKRTSSNLHPYANQTINQLLSEMDGFAQNEGIIVIGATNRKEDLDKALLRPGRFDVQVHVSIPDFTDRKDIFKLYLSKIIHENINVTTLAKGTTGFTGADIENMVNQSALKAATEGANRVNMRHLDEARDRILMGPARLRGKLPDEEANKNTAYHEAGHAIMAHFTPCANPLHKVTIIPRGQSLGHTALLPDKDMYLQTKAQIMAEIDVTMGGRVAEELIFGLDKITTGAADDLKTATQRATALVKYFGMSEKVGLRDFSSALKSNGIVAVNELSPQAREAIDQEINRILQDSYNRSKDLLTKHKREHHLLAEALLQYETLNAKEIAAVIKGEKILREESQLTLPAISVLSGNRRKRDVGGAPLVQIQVKET